MKVKVEIEEALEEDYVVIRCKRLNEQIIQVQNLLVDIGSWDKTKMANYTGAMTVVKVFK